MDINWDVGAGIKVHECAYENPKFYKKLQSLNLLLEESDYSFINAKYLDEITPIDITCNSHGDFQAIPKDLRKKNFIGCTKCKDFYYKKERYTQESFIQKCIEANGERFNYSNIDFKGFKYTIYPECKIHGTISCKNPKTHLTYTTCPKCRGMKKRFTTERFIKKAKEIHKDLFNYDKSIYIDSRSPINIYCNYCKDYFTVNQATWHLQGHGCNKCNSGGFNSAKAGLLYYISIDNGQAYKVGITNRTVKDRYSPADFKRIKVIKTWKYEFGNEARERELEILRTFKSAKYTGSISLESCTHKEMFNQDILLLDTN
jgi:hypothetical protein